MIPNKESQESTDNKTEDMEAAQSSTQKTIDHISYLVDDLKLLNETEQEKEEESGSVINLLLSLIPPIQLVLIVVVLFLLSLLFREELSYLFPLIMKPLE
jgi:hypothetical protein